MAWQEPKTNWRIQPTGDSGKYNGDWFNVSDYARIKGNLEYLAERISAIFNVVTLISMTTPQPSDIEVAIRLNAVESNIDILKQSMPFPVILPSTKTWRGNGNSPTVADLNRIESCCLTLYNALQGQSAFIWRIPFKMGGKRF